MENIEYRVRPVTRYVVTRYEDQIEKGTGAIRTLGEYDNQQVAQEVGYALCKAEHERLGFAPGDPRIIYPQMIPAQAVDSTFAGFGSVNVSLPIKPCADGIGYEVDESRARI